MPIRSLILMKVGNTNSNGFTLMEILIAFLLLAIISVGLVNLFISSSRFITKSQGRMSAGEIGRRFIDPLHMDVNEAAWGNNCLSGVPPVGCPAAQALGQFIFTPTYTTSQVSNPAGTAIELRRVRAQLDWDVN